MSALAMRLRLSGSALLALAGPLVVVMILGMMVLPLPPFLLDLLFTFNIALALIVLLGSMYSEKPLDFAVFPTVLLLTTLMRLSLNVASTRVVLLHGHSGTDAAGKVIQAFGEFLVGGNFAVGLVVFAILVVINFVVITKGAGRIAEVGARFTLDAMPGKQMAIDADLNAGLIAEDEARRRRAEIAAEADFYGAMDGASKFVRGDAIAGILVLFINIIGGLVIGTLQHDLSFARAANNYVLLAVGDGLVAQIPALVISTAAGLIVSRVGKGEATGSQLMSQIFRRPETLVIAAVVLAALGLVPGMPHFAFLLLAAILGTAAHHMVRRSRTPPPPSEVPATAAPEEAEVGWDDLAPLDVLGIEIGYRLISLVDKGPEGELLRRIKAIRRKFVKDVGFVPPVVHIRDNLELPATAYRITLKGVVVAEGECRPGKLLAIDPGRTTGTLPGAPTKDPAFGLPAVWIDTTQSEQAQVMGFTVVDPGTVIATHLSTILQSQSASLLGRQELQGLLDQVAKTSPKLIEELTPKLLPLPVVQRVLQNLLEDNVHIRDLRSIFETLADHATRSQDANELTAAVRVALGKAIVQQVFGSASELNVVELDPELERMLQQVFGVAGADGAGLEPELAETLVREISNAAQQLEAAGKPAVLLVPDRLRVPIARLMRRPAPEVRVLGHSEVQDVRTIRVAAIIGGKR